MRTLLAARLWCCSGGHVGWSGMRVGRVTVREMSTKRRISGEALVRHFNERREAPIDDSERVREKRVGLMGIPGLHTAEDISGLQQKSLSDVRDETSRLLSLSASYRGRELTREGALAILASMDTISERICLAADSAELCRCVHPHEEFRQRADNMASVMGAAIHELNATPELHEAATMVTTSREAFGQLSDGQRHVATQLQADFETFQRTADGRASEGVTKSQQRIWELSSRFEQRIATLQPEREGILRLSSAEASILGSPFSVVSPPEVSEGESHQRLWEGEGEREREGREIERGREGEKHSDSVRVKETIGMTYTEKERKRETERETERKGESERAKEKQRATERGKEREKEREREREREKEREGEESGLLSVELTESVYHATQNSPIDSLRRKGYVAYHRLLADNRGRMQALVDERRAMAKLLEFPSYAHLSMVNRGTKEAGEITAFLDALAAAVQPQAKSALSHLSRSFHSLQEREDGTLYPWDYAYFSALRQQRETHNLHISEYLSLGNCMKGLSDITQELFGAELRVAPVTSTERWHPLVQKVEVVHETEGLLGVIYLDLFERHGKFHNPANFSLQFATKCNKWALPRMAVVCPFPLSSSPDTPPLLSYSHAVTLFHEFGHALNNIFSRTEYHHNAGVRAPVDFVETPSTLMEFFLKDYRVVERFARHYVTGEPIPRDLFSAFIRGKGLFASIDTQREVALSIYDLSLHGEEEVDVGEEYHRILGKYSLVPPAPDTWWYARFGHVCGYGASYYTYLLCKAVSTSLWEKFFKENPLSREVGDVYRKEVLEKGGEADPLHMLQAMHDKCAPGGPRLTRLPPVQVFADSLHQDLS